MCDQTEITYSDGDIVWVKLGSCWWPGEVCGFDKLPPGILKSFRKQPIAVVKFFQEESFEYVKNINLIYKYNCSRKNDFIKKGLDLFRSKHSHMDKFPEDVCTAERRTDGNPDIITDDEFLPKKKESYANIFGSPSDSVNQIKKTPGKRGRPPGNTSKWKIKSAIGASSSLKDTPKITHPRIIQKYLKGTSDYKAHILVQPNNLSSPDVFGDNDVELISSQKSEETTPVKSKIPEAGFSSAGNISGMYSCHACNFTSTRLNVMILHNKSHSAGFVPYTPVKKPISRSPLLKAKSKSETLSSVHSDDNTDYTDTKKRTKIKIDRRSRGRPKNILQASPTSTSPSPTKMQNKDKITPPKRKLKVKDKEAKKPKTDIEIKNSLLADWNEDSDDESMDILTSLKLTENQNMPASILDSKDNSDISEQSPIKNDKSSLDNADVILPKTAISEELPKSGKREQTSCFDFQEDEDLQIERLDRKIPRLSSKSDDFTKKILESNIGDVDSGNYAQNISGDTNINDTSNANKIQNDIADFDAEVSNLLKETVLPELPSLPSESNFQKTKVVKVPDKEKDGGGGGGGSSDTQYIFKTKTFFRSRHSRSQEAIEKYVTDNTSTDKPPTYMEGTADSEKSNDIAIESPPIKSPFIDDEDDDKNISSKTESAKVVKFTPKIQPKKSKSNILDEVRQKSQYYNLKYLKTSLEKSEVQDEELLKSVKSIDQVKNQNSSKDQILDTSNNIKSEDNTVKEKFENTTEKSLENLPTESDLQIAEALINLPSSTIHSVDEKSNNNTMKLSTKYQSGKVAKEMSDSHVIPRDTVVDSPSTYGKNDRDNVTEGNKSQTEYKNFEVDKHTTKLPDLSSESPKLFQILDESNKAKVKEQPLKTLPTKMNKPQGKEKILNFNVASSSPLKHRKTAEDENIVIRMKTSRSQQELVLSNKSSKWNDDEIQTFTIEATSGSNEDLLDPKLKKVSKNSSQSYLTKSHNTILNAEIKQNSELRLNDEALLEANLRPVVPSGIKTNENQLKSDSLLATQLSKHTSIASETVKSESALIPENISERSSTKTNIDISPTKKPKIVVKPTIEKTVSPNILSKSIKAKAMKNLVVIDKNIDDKRKQVSLSDNNVSQSYDKECLQKKNLLINANKSPKTQKIILNAIPKSQKPSGLLTESGQTSPSSKPVSGTMKLNQIITERENPVGNSVMIITTQGVQSKIVLTPEHQKLLFPKHKSSSQPSSVSSITPSAVKDKTHQSNSDLLLNSESVDSLSTSESQIKAMHMVSKAKTTILNSKNQIVMSGSGSKRTILTTTPGQAILTSKGQIIAPQSSVITSSAKLLPNVNKSTTIVSPNTQNVRSTKTAQAQKLVGRIHPATSKEKALIGSSTILHKVSKPQTIMQGQIKDASSLLSQKSGTITLTAAQFEHLQRTGQLITKSGPQKSLDSKISGGKIQNQRFILKRVIDSKQSSVDLSDTKKTFSTEVPPLTPINSDKTNSTLLKRQKPKDTITQTTNKYNSNDIKMSDSDDSSAYDNLDKLIPATIIPTRKRDAPTPEISLKDKHITKHDNANVATPQITSSVSQNPAEVTESGETQILSTSSLDAQKQLLAIPGENFGGPPNSFFLCVEENGALTPVDNQPLVLENNQLVPMAMASLPVSTTSMESESVTELTGVSKESQQQPTESSQMLELPVEQAQQSILINTGEQQLLLDHQTLLSLLSGDGQQLVTTDGQQVVLQGGTQQILSMLAGIPGLADLFASGQQILLNASEGGMAQQEVGATEQKSETLPFLSDVQPNVNQDILAAALASTEVFQPEENSATTTVETVLMEIDSLSPNVNVNTNTPVHSNVFETSSTLNQPIMSPLEHPTKKRTDEKPIGPGLLAISKDTKIIPKNLEDSLAVIGVATTNVPTSLELPITVTNPRIAAKTTSPLGLSCSTVYQSGLLGNSIVSPGINIFDSESTSDTMSLTESSNKIIRPIKQNVEIINNKPSELSAEIDKKISSETTDPMTEVNVASSMPCLDDSSVESHSEEVVSHVSDEIPTKSYSPISMPILTDDPDEQMVVDTDLPITPVDPSVEIPVGLSIEPPIKTPLEPAMETSIGELMDTTTASLTETPLEPSIETPVGPTTETLIESSTEIPSIETPTEPTIESPIESTETPLEHSVKTPAGIATETTIESTEILLEQPVKTPTGIAMEIPIESTIENPIETSVDQEIVAKDNQPTIAENVDKIDESAEETINEIFENENDLSCDLAYMVSQNEIVEKAEDMVMITDNASSQSHILNSSCNEDQNGPDDKKIDVKADDTNHLNGSNHIKSKELQEAKSEILIQSSVPASDTSNDVSHADPETDDICADTPPDFTQSQSPVHYDEEQDIDEEIIQNETEENSILEHAREETSEMATLPDSTSSSLEAVSMTPEPPQSNLVFSDSSSDASTEIPIQPMISVSHHLVQNFSSLLNNVSSEDKSKDCANSESKLCDDFDNNEKTMDGYDVDNER